jgi:hypothetical protein
METFSAVSAKSKQLKTKCHKTFTPQQRVRRLVIARRM